REEYLHPLGFNTGGLRVVWVLIGVLSVEVLPVDHHTGVWLQLAEADGNVGSLVAVHPDGILNLRDGHDGGLQATTLANFNRPDDRVVTVYELRLVTAGADLLAEVLSRGGQEGHFFLLPLPV